MTKRHRKKWVDALSLVLPVLLFFAVLNCFTTYLYYQDYQCKMDILTEVAAGAETTGMDVAAGWLKGNDHQANEQGKQLLEQYGYLGVAKLGIDALVLKAKGFDCKDIAALYHTSSNNVGAWISRAAKRLRSDPDFLDAFDIAC